MTRPLFSWRHAILHSGLPATTRHVLLTLSVHMNDAGESCFPSVRRLAAETGLSERAICTHIQRARSAGWLAVSVHGFGGQKWKRHEYSVSVPAGFVVGPVAEKGTERGSAAAEKGTERGSAAPKTKALNEVRKGTERGSAKALNEGQSNSTGKSTDNAAGKKTPVRADASRTPARAQRFEEFWTAYPVKREKKRAREAWARKRLDDRADEIIADVHKRVAEDGQWLQGYIPHASTYLNGERWDDEFSPPPAVDAKDDAEAAKVWQELESVLPKGSDQRAAFLAKRADYRPAIDAIGGLQQLSLMPWPRLRSMRGQFLEAVAETRQSAGGAR